MTGMINPTNAADLRAANRQARTIKANPHAKEAIENFSKGGLQLPALPQTDYVELAGKNAAPTPEAKKGIKGAIKKGSDAVAKGFHSLKELVCKSTKNKVIAGAVAAVAVAGAAFGIYKGVQAHNNKAEAHQA